MNIQHCNFVTIADIIIFWHTMSLKLNVIGLNVKAIFKKSKKNCSNKTEKNNSSNHLANVWIIDWNLILNKASDVKIPL